MQKRRAIIFGRTNHRACDNNVYSFARQLTTRHATNLKGHPKDTESISWIQSREGTKYSVARKREALPALCASQPKLFMDDGVL